MDNVLPSLFHDCLISSTIGTVRGGGIQESSSSNSSSEPDVLDVSADKMGKSCGLVKPFSFELYDVHIEEDTADYVEVEVYDKDAQKQPMIIVKNLVGNVLNVSNVSEETLSSQYGTLLEHTSSPKGRGKKNVDKTKKSLRKSKDNLQELKCSACQKVFSDSSDFHKHVEIHRPEKLYQCDQCCKTFRQLNHFNMHKQIHTERTFKCDICLETLKSNSSLKSHMKKHLGVKNYVCNVCPAAFHSKYELKIHNIKHAGDLPYSCLVCGDKFPVKSRLKRHMMIHTGERPFQCEVCGVIFREQLTLDIHMSVHLSRRPFVCDVCGEKFSRLNGLTLHQRVHITDDTYSYVAKRKSIDEKDSLSSAKPQDSNSFIENCMGDELASKIDSSHPLETKLESKTLNLPVTETSNSLKVDGTLPTSSSEDTSAARCNLEKCLSEVEGTNIPHPGVIRDVLSSGTILKSQEDGKGYFIMLPRTLTEKNCTLYTAYPSSVVSSCKINESQVTSDKDNEQDSQNNDNLFASDGHIDSARHSAIQLNQESDAEEVVTKFKKVKKLKSTICDDTASESGLQSRKMERSTKKKVKKANGSKFYHCDQCGRNYKTSSNLNVHLRTHTGERPYYCDFCGRGFKQMAHLQSHVRIHTGENPYQCELCDQAFNQSSRLKYHIQNKHVSVRKKRVKVAKQYYVRNFYCKICDHTFIDSCYKSDHMRTHLQDRESKESPESSKRNINLQHDVQQSVDFGICELCGFQYKDVKALRLHKEESHGITEDAKETADMLSNSTCSADSINQAKECTGSSHTKADSIINKETSTKDCVPCIKPLNCGKYKCSVCHKTFNTRSNANIHLRLHSNVRPYVCSDCGKAFRQISHLKDHVKMHTGEKPFSCSVCHATFAQSSSVKAHIKKCHKGQGSTIKSKKEQNIKQEFITVESVSPASNDTLVVSIESSH